MKTFSYRFFLFYLSLFLVIPVSVQGQTELYERLTDYFQEDEIEYLESPFYQEKYVLRMLQYLDHSESRYGFFKQRIIVCHAGFDKPTVLVTEGYGADYALHSGYREELSELFDANVIVVEHRYFGKSLLPVKNWNFLTAENSAYDLHEVTSLFKEIYTGKWISTGISKGGQTTALYRTYFPDDVDISVPYVAPLNRAVEDKRPISFFKKVGKKSQRKKIYTFQKEVLTRKQEMVPLLEAYSLKENLTYRIPLEEVLDYCVLEYPFAFWQWGTSVGMIPPVDADTGELFEHLMKISSPDYFSNEQPYGSFFVQAARELGYYPYATRRLATYLTIPNATGYLKQLMLPEDAEEITYSDALYQKIYDFLEQNDPRMIFIYGENDPWSATRVPSFKKKKNLQVYIQPRGSHKARIKTMPEPVQQRIIEQIRAWLEE